jgi:ribosomal protein L21E
MEGGDQICVPSSLYGQTFKEGDMVHVFEGTGVGRVKNRDQGWFGKVVGREGDFFLVRNRLLAAKGRPTRVEPQYMKKQVDFGLTSGSEDRIHFRSLTKRTRDRILQSSDEHNNWQAKDAQKQLVKAKKQKTLEKESYLMRRQQILTQGTSAKDQYTNDFAQQLKYWHEKCDSLQEKLRTNQENTKRTMQKAQVLSTFYRQAFVLAHHLHLLPCLALLSILIIVIFYIMS